MIRCVRELMFQLTWFFQAIPVQAAGNLAAMDLGAAAEVADPPGQEEATRGMVVAAIAGLIGTAVEPEVVGPEAGGRAAAVELGEGRPATAVDRLVVVATVRRGISILQAVVEPTLKNQVRASQAHKSRTRQNQWPPSSATSTAMG